MSDYTYDDWADLLADFYFDKAHAGEEILFAVDDRSLSEASGLDEDEAPESLARAVASVVGPNWQIDGLERNVSRWRQRGALGAHPAIPFLALTVLAAERMGSEEQIAVHNYYVPLRHLLNPLDEEEGDPGTFTEYITGLWEDLERWANDDLDGTRGRLVVRDPGYFPYVGLAFQHSLVRSSDLRQLDAFFRRIGLEPGEEVERAELRRALAAWTAGRTEPWAIRLHRVSTQADLAEYCEALLGREADRWDGRPHDPRTGRPIGRIRLGLSSLRRPSLGLFVQWDERLADSVEVVLPHGIGTTLTRSDGWYEPSPLREVSVENALADGLELRGDDCRFDFRAERAYALAYDDDLGGWVSVDAMSFGDRYHLLVRNDSAAEALRYVKRESAIPSHLDDAASKLLPPGWSLLRDVQIDARPRTKPPSDLGSLVPAGGGPRIRLLGGLPIGPIHACYLRGGEPALGLSNLNDERHIEICRESTGKVERFLISDIARGEVPLWPYRLEPDRYEVRHGESRVKFQIVDGIVEAAGPGAGTIHHGGRDSITVIGTESDVGDPARAKPITVPAPSARNEVIVIGARCDEHLVVELPTWLSSLVGFELSWATTDAWPNFEPVWCFRRGSSGRYVALMLNEIEPIGSEPTAMTQWGRLIGLATLAPTEDETAASLWARYRDAVGASR